MKKVVAGMLWAVVLGSACDLWAVGEKGTILFEYWDGLDAEGVSVDPLLADSRWPANPTAEEWRNRLEGDLNRADSYGTRVRGYLYPPRTGDFTFWIASDDSSELWLSPGETPGGAEKIACVNGYTAWRNWTTFGSQKSLPRRLEAGKRYYIEVRHVEGHGDDNLSVGWSGPGVTGSAATRPVIMDGRYLSAYIRDKDRLASQPRPADLADDLRPEAPVLQWAAGYGAASHQVFLGTSPDQLQSMARQISTTFLVESGLIPGQRYFWRIDEIEADGKTVHRGNLWSFTGWPCWARR